MKLTQSDTKLLQFLETCYQPQRIVLLKSLSKHQLKVLVEIIYNILKGVIPLSSKYKKSLFKYRSSIRLLTSKKVTVKTRQSKLVKIQEIIPLIIRAYWKYES